MLDSSIAPIAAWIVSVISAAGYAGIAGLMAIESACIPLPSEVIMPFAGYLASTGRFSLVLAATAGAVGCNVGSTLAYAVGARGGRGLVERWGHYILLNPGDLDRADRFFRRFGGPAVLVARLLPVGTHLHRPARRHRANAGAAVPALHLHRLMALVLRPGLHRLPVRRALGNRSSAASRNAPIRSRHRRLARARTGLVHLQASSAPA